MHYPRMGGYLQQLKIIPPYIDDMGGYLRRSRHVVLAWFEGVVDSSRVLIASGFGYLENQSFELTPYNVTTPPIRGCLATWCWWGFEGVVDSSQVLTVSGFGYLENQSFERTPHNVTAPPIRKLYKQWCG